jgi:hypothetical protein
VLAAYGRDYATQYWQSIAQVATWMHLFSFIANLFYTQIITFICSNVYTDGEWFSCNCCSLFVCNLKFILCQIIAVYLLLIMLQMVRMQARCAECQLCSTDWMLLLVEGWIHWSVVGRLDPFRTYKRTWSWPAGNEKRSNTTEYKCGWRRDVSVSTLFCSMFLLNHFYWNTKQQYQPWLDNRMRRRDERWKVKNIIQQTCLCLTAADTFVEFEIIIVALTKMQSSSANH